MSAQDRHPVSALTKSTNKQRREIICVTFPSFRFISMDLQPPETPVPTSTHSPIPQLHIKTINLLRTENLLMQKTGMSASHHQHSHRWCIYTFGDFRLIFLDLPGIFTCVCLHISNFKTNLFGLLRTNAPITLQNSATFSTNSIQFPRIPKEIGKRRKLSREAVTK